MLGPNCQTAFDRVWWKTGEALQEWNVASGQPLQSLCETPKYRNKLYVWGRVEGTPLGWWQNFFEQAQDFYTITQMLLCGRMSSKIFLSCMDILTHFCYTNNQWGGVFIYLVHKIAQTIGKLPGFWRFSDICCWFFPPIIFMITQYSHHCK